MKPSPDQLRLLRAGGEDQQVSAAAALDFVRDHRARGGGLPLLATAVLLIAELGFALGGVVEPTLFVGAVLVWFPLHFLLKRGLRSAAAQRALDDASRLDAPVRAALGDRVLLLGTAGSPPEQWCAVDVTEAEVKRIRTLALPAARVRPR